MEGRGSEGTVEHEEELEAQRRSEQSGIGVILICEGDNWTEGSIGLKAGRVGKRVEWAVLFFAAKTRLKNTKCRNGGGVTHMALP
jgi:hypothetical protein